MEALGTHSPPPGSRSVQIGRTHTVRFCPLKAAAAGPPLTCAQCQADEAFPIPESEAVLPLDGIQGFIGPPDHDDHSPAQLRLRQNIIQALTVHRTALWA